MGKNCGSPPKIAENCGKIAEIAENCGNCGKIADIAKKLRTAIPPPLLNVSGGPVIKAWVSHVISAGDFQPRILVTYLREEREADMKEYCAEPGHYNGTTIASLSTHLYATIFLVCRVKRRETYCNSQALTTSKGTHAFSSFS